jgi:transposase
MKRITLSSKQRAHAHLHVVRGNEVKWISQSDGKTGTVDAKKLTELARENLLPRKSPIVEELVRELRPLLSARHTLQNKRIDVRATIPSIGRRSSRVPPSVIDNAAWFDGKKGMATYDALTRRLSRSGAHIRLGHANRNGRQEMRQVLVQCPHPVACMQSHATRPLRGFHEWVMRRVGKKIAIVAVARELLTIAYRVVKHGLGNRR